MCGIIGRVSLNTSCLKTLKGLKFLEYRGYDSYGVLLWSLDSKENVLSKDVSELPDKEFKRLSEISSNIEIGHTRWATHGGISKENAHPHFDSDKEFFVVMNGIIENYLDVKADLINSGFEFVSETDTEVIPHLFSKFFVSTGDVFFDLRVAANKVFEVLKGEFSFVVRYENCILAFKNINPIAIGVSKDEVFICSDSSFVQNNSDEFYIMNDSDIFVCSVDSDRGVVYDFFKDESSFKPELKKSVKFEENSENVFSTYMEKEINEQKFLRNIINSENLSSIKYLRNVLKSKQLVLTAAGTSYHAAYVMHYKLLKMGIFSQVIVASELNNYCDVINDSIIVVLSQSGETADLIFPLKKLRDSNEIFTITNTANSTLARFANRCVFLNCGREVSVASTKAFSSQVFVADLLISEFEGTNLDSHLLTYEVDFEKVIASADIILDKICERFKDASDFFFIGRDVFHPFALEGALKLKECTYIHAEGFAGGELKHGTLALITDDVPVIVIGSGAEIVSNAIEIKTRGGVLIGITSEANEVYDYQISVPENFEEIFTTIVMQRLSLKMAVARGLNPDKPRNLAKSVTVK